MFLSGSYPIRQAVCPCPGVCGFSCFWVLFYVRWMARVLPEGCPHRPCGLSGLLLREDVMQKESVFSQLLRDTSAAQPPGVPWPGAPALLEPTSNSQAVLQTTSGFYIVESTSWGFPGSLVVKTLHFQQRGAQAQFLVKKLRSCMLHSMAKKKKKF